MNLSAEEAFRDEDWRGSYYQLAIELSPQPDDARLTSALETLSASIDRCPAPEESDEELHAVETDFIRSIYGSINLPEVNRLGVRALVLREKEGSDFLDLCVPTGMMERAGYRMEDPLSEGFLAALDRSFLRIAEKVCESAPFDLALLGEEVSGLLHMRDFFEQSERAEWYVRHGGLLIRPALLKELPTRVVAERRPNGLLYIERSRNVA
jgi:hypothetical protein